MSLYPGSTGTGDPGLALIASSLCPPHHSSTAEASDRHADLLTDLSLLSTLPPPSTLLDPARHISQLPLSWPYLGFSPYTLLVRLAAAYAHLFPLPSLSSIPHRVIADPLDPLGATPPLTTSPLTIRVGVVAEYAGNTSPGQLIGTVLSSLPRETFTLIFFTYPNLDTDFSHLISSRAESTFSLVPGDTVASQKVVRDAEVDVLVYVAVGMNPLTYYMAM